MAGNAESGCGRFNHPFSKCHHGWSYHPTTVGKIHPHLSFDLLRKQYDATKEAGINAPVYLSAGLDNFASNDHPEWIELNKDGYYVGRENGALRASPTVQSPAFSAVRQAERGVQW
jgi:hypothetical protein